MSKDCVFCKIAGGEIKSDIVFEDDNFTVFKDLDPQAPVHLLIIPKKHIPTLNDVSGDDAFLLGGMLEKIKDIAGDQGISEAGYRIVINCNKGAGQEVFHLHFHLLGGRHFGWPPG